MRIAARAIATVALAIVALGNPSYLLSQGIGIHEQVIRYEGLPGGRCDGEPRGQFAQVSKYHDSISANMSIPPPVQGDGTYTSAPKVSIWCNFINLDRSDSMALRRVAIYYDVHRTRDGWLTGRICQRRIGFNDTSCGEKIILPDLADFQTSRHSFMRIDVPQIKRDSTVWLEIELRDDLGRAYVNLYYVEAEWIMPLVELPAHTSPIISRYMSAADVLAEESNESYRDLREAFESESEREAWAGKKRESILQYLSDYSEAAKIESVDCRSTLCEVKIGGAGPRSSRGRRCNGRSCDL